VRGFEEEAKAEELIEKERLNETGWSVKDRVDRGRKLGIFCDAS